MVAEGIFTPARAEAIRRREVSSLEIVDAYLAQIARHNPNLNAVVTLDEHGEEPTRSTWSILSGPWSSTSLPSRLLPASAGSSTLRQK
jgi:hypothetical protein